MILDGRKEYLKFMKGKSLTPEEAILGKCYACTGLYEGGEDCRCSKICPLYSFCPYKGKMGWNHDIYL